MAIVTSSVPVTLANHVSERFCSECGLPMAHCSRMRGRMRRARAYEAPEPADPDVARLIANFVKRTGYDANSSGRGCRSSSR